MASFLGLLHIRPGEGRRVLWLSAISIAYAAATSLGDDIAQSVFVTRAGAQALPRVFLFKAVIDVVAAALYLPLTRGRSASALWRVALAIYMTTVLVVRVLAHGGGVASAYALYIAHECAWTILTIHWGVFILDAFDASQARRLFPLLFTAARLGDIAAGTALHTLAERLGAVNLLAGSVFLAGSAAAISLLDRRVHAGNSSTSLPPVAEQPDQTRADDDTGAEDPHRADSSQDRTRSVGTWRIGWLAALASPLVRIIAVSTAAMVLVRYGLHVVSIDEISRALHQDEDMVASFLGWFGAWANVLGAILGVFVVPRLLTRFGVGVANVMYAVATTCAYSLLIAVPGLWIAALARLTNVQLKNALKTPLSTLFYGAEPPPERARARAFIFGAVIPAATVVTAVVFELAARRGLEIVAWIGLAGAVFFTVACAVQNRRWRRRLADLLLWKLDRGPVPEPGRLSRVRQALAPHGGQVPAERLEEIACALANPDPRLQAVGEELLAETIPRMRAHAITRRFVVGADRD
ncbi:MAG: hypothetical protein MJE77_21410 [Proteobacteria bacterium]|nr:hypothetical protein [Pseudomonadota bacterium]